MLSPLRRLTSLKLKVGILSVVAMSTAIVAMIVADDLGVRRPVAVAIAIVVTLVAVQVVAHGTTSPLREMERAATAMASGDHSQRVTVRTADEIGRLAVAFNTMAAEIETLDRGRRDMLADAAHELRTPIAALRANLENAADGIGTVDPEALLQQVERLGHMAEELLDLAALEAGIRVISPRPFPAGNLALAAPGCVIDIPEDLTIMGDEPRLRQVVAGLVDNADRHAPGATVTLRVSRRGDAVRVEVEDDGPGVAPDDAERVFQRFTRADRSRTVPGAGLGLAIARSIIESHDGTIVAENVTPHGCRMVITLPDAHADPPRVPASR